jgi:lipase maturation factor 1
MQDREIARIFGAVPMDPARVEGAPSAERPTYVLSRWLFLRLLGVVYFIAFVSLAVQITGLVGERGLLPAGAFLEQAHASYGGAAYRLFPTLCWLGAGNGMLRLFAWCGGALALCLVAGVAQVTVLALLWLLYLSLSVVGQEFLWFQWDALLLETGLVALLYAPLQWRPDLTRERAPSVAARWLLWALLFKLAFLSGITKLASGDPAWRDLTALDYHFWTQPLPPWTAWYAAQSPEWLHRAMTLAILAIELVVPWFILVPRQLERVRLAACALLALGQFGIALTGNYGFFNLLSIVLCVPLLPDGLVRRVVPLQLIAGDAEPRWRTLTVRGLVAVLGTLSVLAFFREIAGTLPGGGAIVGNPLLRAVAPFRSVNGYGLFRVMTTDRPEIVIEGSADSVHWREYEFRWKPGDPTRRPAFVAPHQPRLDWQMWFAALDPERAKPWLASLLRHLLLGTPDVLGLLEGNPFPGAPPRYVRLAYYRYRFSTSAERARNGAWWERTRAADLTGPLSLPGR